MVVILENQLEIRFRARMLRCPSRCSNQVFTTPEARIHPVTDSVCDHRYLRYVSIVWKVRRRPNRPVSFSCAVRPWSGIECEQGREPPFFESQGKLSSEKGRSIVAKSTIRGSRKGRPARNPVVDPDPTSVSEDKTFPPLLARAYGKGRQS